MQPLIKPFVPRAASMLMVACLLGATAPRAELADDCYFDQTTAEYQSDVCQAFRQGVVFANSRIAPLQVDPSGTRDPGQIYPYIAPDTGLNPSVPLNLYQNNELGTAPGGALQ